MSPLLLSLCSARDCRVRSRRRRCFNRRRRPHTENGTPLHANDLTNQSAGSSPRQRSAYTGSRSVSQSPHRRSSKRSDVTHGSARDDAAWRYDVNDPLRPPSTYALLHACMMRISAIAGNGVL